MLKIQNADSKQTRSSPIKTSLPFQCMDNLSIIFNTSKSSFVCSYMHIQIQLEVHADVGL
jgi:hypothetical protein